MIVNTNKGDKMETEVEKKVEFEYVEPSNVGEFYLKHVEAMKPTEDQPEGKSFAIGREGYSLALLRELADASNVGKRAIVVVEWPEVFEVQRLPDGSNTKLFYRYSTGDKKGRVNHSEVGDSVSDIKNILSQYLETEYEDCLKYDQKLNSEAKAEKIISYSYIQRRSASLASFRKAPEGKTERLKDTINALIEMDVLKQVPDNVAAGSFETNGKLYQIVGSE